MADIAKNRFLDALFDLVRPCILTPAVELPRFPAEIAPPAVIVRVISVHPLTITVIADSEFLCL